MSSIRSRTYNQAVIHIILHLAFYVIIMFVKIRNTLGQNRSPTEIVLMFSSIGSS